MHFSKNSWHYLLAKKYGGLPIISHYEHFDDGRNSIEHERYEGDLCTYLRHLTGGLIVTSLIVFISTLISMMLLIPVAWLFARLMTGTWLIEYDYHLLNIGPAFLYGVIFYIVMDANNAWSKIAHSASSVFRSTQPKVKKDSFIVAVYKTIRHKMCFKLTVS